jgi:alkylation response protein AidB-like acyl-CoA dehydrogenase
MALALNEEQRLLAETAHDFAATKSPITELRGLRDRADPTGFSKALWQEMAELGWAGIAIEEAYGGVGFGYLGLGLVLQETGRSLTASPLLSTALLGATAVQLAGSNQQRQDILPAIAAGDRLMALAVDEGPRHRPDRMAFSATAADGGFLLNGEKTLVLDGHVADQLIVAARSDETASGLDGITLFLVDANAAGVERVRTTMVDSRNAARIRFHNVAVDQAAMLGELNQGGPLLDRILDYGRIGLAAEMLGGVLEAFERTIAYLKMREQFGVAIGSFQALKHRAAVMFSEIELAKSVVLDALTALDEGRDDIAAMASLAKARLSETFFLVGNEALQMHGGIGMTDEEEIGFFLKRARVAQATFGDAAFHRDRYAAIAGY